MNIFGLILSLLGTVVLGIIFIFLIAKYSRRKIWVILYYIITILVSFFCSCIFYTCIVYGIASEDFLEHTTKYQSGNTMNGSEAVFWFSVIVFGIVFSLLRNFTKKISRNKYL